MFFPMLFWPKNLGRFLKERLGFGAFLDGFSASGTWLKCGKLLAWTCPRRGFVLVGFLRGHFWKLEFFGGRNVWNHFEVFETSGKIVRNALPHPQKIIVRLFLSSEFLQCGQTIHCAHGWNLQLRGDLNIKTWFLSFSLFKIIDHYTKLNFQGSKMPCN